MKKFLCIVVAFAFCCIFSLPCTATAQSDNVLSYEEAVAQEKKIAELFDRQVAAFFQNDINTAENIEKELATYGMKEVNGSEARQILTSSSPSIVPYEQEYEDDKYIYYRGNVDMRYNGKEYSYTLLTVSPKVLNCKLVKAGSMEDYTPNYGTSIAEDSLALKTIFNTTITALGYIPELGDYISIAAFFGETIQEVIEYIKENSRNVVADYTWNIWEYVSYILTPSPDIPGVFIPIAFYNKVQGSVTVTMNGYAGTQTSNAYPIEWRAPHFTSGSDAIKHYVDTNGGKLEEKMESVDIVVPNGRGEKIIQVKLQNPQDYREL